MTVIRNINLYHENLADDKLLFSYFFLRKQNLIFHEIRDNLHEMSKPVFWKKNKKKYFKISSAEIFTQSAER